MGELLALLTALLHAIGVVLYKRAIAFVTPFGLNLFKNCVALVIFVSTAVFLSTTVSTSISATDFALMLVSGAIWHRHFGHAPFHDVVETRRQPNRAGRLPLQSLHHPDVVSVLERNVGSFSSPRWRSHTCERCRQFEPRFWRGHYTPAILDRLWSGSLVDADRGIRDRPGRAAARRLSTHTPDYDPNGRRSRDSGVAGPILSSAKVCLRRLSSATSLEIHDSGERSLVPYLLSLFCWLAGFKYAKAGVVALLNQTSTILIVVFAALF